MLRHRSIYRVKSEFLPTLEGLFGFEISPSESLDYINIQVIECDTPIKFFNKSLACVYSLPQSSDSQLVHTLLKQLEKNYLSIANARVLRKYLQLSKMQDKNNKIKSDLRVAIKRIVMSLLILGGGLGGLSITLFYMPIVSVLFAAFAPLMLIPLALFALAVVDSVINLFIGLVALGIGIFSVCFRLNNSEELTIIKDRLEEISDQQSQLLPPNYRDLFGNTSVSTAKSLSLASPPPYQDVVHNSAVLSTAPVSSPPMYTLRSLASNPAQFFYFPPPGAGITTNAAVPLLFENVRP